jgi:hypothetical protein
MELVCTTKSVISRSMVVHTSLWMVDQGRFGANQSKGRQHRNVPTSCRCCGVVVREGLKPAMCKGRVPMPLWRLCRGGRTRHQSSECKREASERYDATHIRSFNSVRALDVREVRCGRPFAVAEQNMLWR